MDKNWAWKAIGGTAAFAAVLGVCILAGLWNAGLL